MGFRLHAAIAGLWLVWLAGCSSRETLWLLEVSGLENRNPEPGEALEFSGRGFPPGRPGEVVLRGELSRPGREGREVRWTLPAEARSSERVSATLDATSRRELDGHVRFAGTATVVFTAGEHLAVAGHLEGASIEWTGEDRGPPGLVAEGWALAEALGVGSLEPAGVSGLQVASLAPEGLAARAGLQVGDVIDRASGFRAREVSDLVPPTAVDSLVLEVRAPDGFTREVELPLPAVRGRWLSTVRYLVWACPVVLALWFLGRWRRLPQLGRPEARRSGKLARALAPWRSVWMRVAASKPLRARVAALPAPHAARAPVMALSTAGVCSLAAWQSGHVGLTGLLVLYIGLLVSRSWQGPANWRQHSAGALRLGAPAALLGISLLSAAALSGGTGLAVLAADQGPLPWGWSSLSRPPVLLAAFVAWHCAHRLHARTRLTGARAVLDQLARVLLAAAMVSVFFGGPSVAPSLPHAVELGASGAAFALKTMLVSWALARFEPLQVARLRTLAWTTAAGLMLHAVWLWAMPPRSFEIGLGAALCSSLALAAVFARVERIALARRMFAGSRPPRRAERIRAAEQG